jgi:hypothetical protein
MVQKKKITKSNEPDYLNKEGISEDGTAPKRVISGISAAINIANQITNDNLKRFYVYSRIQGMFDNNPPYSKSSLEKHGLMTNSNVSFGEASEVLADNLVIYHNLFNDVKHLATFETTFASYGEKPNSSENSKIAKILSSEFDKVIRAWEDFYPTMQIHQREYLKFGINTLFWPDERDWRFNVIDTWKFCVPEDATVLSSSLTTALVIHTYKAQELYRIMSIKKMKNTRWKNEGILKVLFQASKSSKDGTFAKEVNPMQAWQKAVRNNSIKIDNEFTDDIDVYSLYVKEYSGKVSRYIFHRDYSDEDSGYMYDGFEFYDKMSEAFLVFTSQPGEMYLHGNKGIGHQIFPKCQVLTKMENGLVDAAARASTVVVSTRAGRGHDLKQIKFVHGGFVDIGEAEFKQNLMGSNLNSNITAIEYFRGKLDRGQVLTGSTSMPSGKRESNAREKPLATSEARVPRNAIAYYYLQLDKLFKEILRKMLKSEQGDPGYEFVEHWIRNCVQQGVPVSLFTEARKKENRGIDDLPLFLNVSATRANGAGSQQAYLEETEGLMTILPILGERGRVNATEDRVAALTGFRNIERYFPEEDRAQQPTEQDTLASIENNQLEQGEMIVVSPDNNHATHCVSHVNRMQQIAKAFREGTYTGDVETNRDPESMLDPALQGADRAFQMLGPHFTRHLIFLSQDPTRTELTKDLYSQWAVLANFGDYLANNAQEQREAEARRMEKKKAEMAQLQAENGPNDPKVIKIMKEHERKLLKLNADIQRNSTRDQLQFILQRQKLSSEDTISRLKAVNEIAINKAKNAEPPKSVGDKDQNSLY